jgi:primosomal protein N' (replication factor Y)
VLIQTYNPEHYAIQAAADHDYATFADKERQIRAELSYPPFSRLVLVRLAGPDQDAVYGESVRVRDECRRAVSARGLEVEILGPVPSPVGRIMDRYRYQILMKGQERRSLFELLGEIGLDGGMKERRGVMISVDIDPTDML